VFFATINDGKPIKRNVTLTITEITVHYAETIN